MTGVPSAPPDPKESVPLNTKKKNRNPPTSLLASSEWEAEEIVPVRKQTMSVDFGRFDMDGVNSDEDDDASLSQHSSEEEKKSDDSYSFHRRSMTDSPPLSASVSSPSKTNTPTKMVGGYERTALLKSHLKKPKISVRKLIQYMRWINMLKVWPKALDLQTIHIDLCNGLLLCRLMAKLVPGTTFVNLHKRPLSRKPAIANIEQALSVIWRGGRVNNSRIPSALDIYTGKTDKITVMISEIFEVYVVRPLIKQAAPSMLNWMNMVLKQYSRSIDAKCVRAPFPKLFSNFTSGVSLFCLIFHFTGPSEIKHRTGTIKINPTLIFETPISLEEYRFNVEYVFKILAALRIETFWTPDEFINFHDTDFLLLQLYKIYSFFVDKRCALPPAQGDAPGVSADSLGEPTVTGMHFKKVGDQQNRDYITSDVLIGNGRDMTVTAPVVVRDVTTIAPHFPPGLICSQTFDVPAFTHEAPIAPVMAEKDESGILLNAEKRRSSFFKLNAASHFVVEKKEEQSDFFIDPSVNSSFGSDLNSSFGTVGGDAEEISEMLEKLRIDREKIENSLREREFALEKEYTKVEQQANLIPASLFDEKFDQLEEQRVALEEEREEFERKYSEREATLRATPIVDSPRRESTMLRSPMSKKERAEEEERKRNMESGWIKATRKTNTQNITMAKKQKESEARIAKSMTRKDGTSFSPFKNQYDADRPVAQQQFDAFGERMRAAQENWLASRESDEIFAIQVLREDRKNRPPPPKNNGGKNQDLESAMAQIRSEELRLMSIEEERRHTQLLESYRSKLSLLKKAEAERKKAEALRSPRKESVMVTQALTFEQQINKKAQQEEADLVEKLEKQNQLQDANMKQQQLMQQQQQQAQQQMQQQQMQHQQQMQQPGQFDRAPQTPVDDSMGVMERLQQSYDNAGGGEGGGEDVNLDVLQWLSMSRTLIIKERNSERQFDFRVVSGGEIAPTDPVRSKSYAIMWGNNGGVAGFISACDIAEIRQSTADPSSMVIVLKPRNPQAVCNSGGLTIVCVRTTSFAECTSYRTGLNSLINNAA
jgi:hypothetical protein